VLLFSVGLETHVEDLRKVGHVATFDFLLEIQFAGFYTQDQIDCIIGKLEVSAQTVYAASLPGIHITAHGEPADTYEPIVHLLLIEIRHSGEFGNAGNEGLQICE
jgi:hypothetical protein